MRGQDRVAAETQARQERQKQIDSGVGVRTWISEGDTKVFRFLEDDGEIYNFAVHPYKIRTKKGNIQTRVDFTCLNDKEDGTACPACEAGMDRKIRGVYNVIERNRPVIRKGGDGKAARDGQGNLIIDGHQDAVVVWDVGSISAEAIRQLDASYKSLKSRDFTVSRTSGSSFQPYVFTPEMDEEGNAIASPMSDADLDLAKDKHNLEEVWAPLSFADAAKRVAQSQAVEGQAGGGGQQQSQTQQQEPPVHTGSPYANLFPGDQQSS